MAFKAYSRSVVQSSQSMFWLLLALYIAFKQLSVIFKEVYLLVQVHNTLNGK